MFLRLGLEIYQKPHMLQSLRSRFYRYLRRSGPLVQYLAKLWKAYFVVIYAIPDLFTICYRAYKAYFVAIYAIPGLLCHM